MLGISDVERMNDFNLCLAIHAEGETSANRFDLAVTCNGGLAYLINFLKVSYTKKQCDYSCPLTYSTLNYSILIGHRRYAPTAVQSRDKVMAGLFGVKTFRSPDSVRLAFEDPNEEATTLESAVAVHGRLRQPLWSRL